MLLGVGEDVARFDDRLDVAEGIEFEFLAGGEVRQSVLRDGNFDLLAGLEGTEKTVGSFVGDDVAAVDRVAKEDAGVGFGDDGVDPRLAQGKGGMLARGAAAKVLAADDDFVLRDVGAGLDEWDVSFGEAGLGDGDAAEGELAVEAAFFAVGEAVYEVLGGDDLVGVDVVAEDVNFSANGFFHDVAFPVPSISLPAADTSSDAGKGIGCKVTKY